ncbi:chemotaxis protein CheX [Paenibacillus thalictri]|uniref:Chemotaxis protein CheX n=1 Tax=Paenibacillus thalictri TaxID=2527873 RepID=A0A4Q9DKL7_9BACL|nr:chemotaxis protein CheX [Paenibacillus thalictri]TBL75341.1 chemotaxis protein CheX [Paenibacillus thalictri]
MQQENGFFEAASRAAVQYFHRLGILKQEAETAEAGEVLFLQDVTAFVQMNGGITGGFLFTLEEGLARELAKRYMLDAITDEEADQYATEVVAEITNVIAGNALTECEIQGVYMGTPLTLVARNAEIRSKCRSKMRHASYITDYGKLQLLYIPAENKAELASILAIRPA